jgi:hypothetical protein
MSNELLTEDQFKRVLPKQLRNNLRPEMMDSINKLLASPNGLENYRENLLGYVNVLKDGKFQMHQYIDAVRYVSFKLQGDSNIKAYMKTFPDRYNKFVMDGTTERDIASYVTAYNKNKLVNLIFEQTLVPSHVLNADLYQKALNVQADLMMNANSEKVRCDAANSILVQLKMPETKKLELNIGLKEDSTLDELRATTLELVAQQRAMIQANAMSVKDVAHSKLLIEGEVLDAVIGSGDEE